jgi:hypothetical protein
VFENGEAEYAAPSFENDEAEYLAPEEAPPEAYSAPEYPEEGLREPGAAFSPSAPPPPQQPVPRWYTPPGGQPAARYAPPASAAPEGKRRRAPKLIIGVGAAIAVIAAAVIFVLPAIAGSAYQRAEGKFFSELFSNAQISALLGSGKGKKLELTASYEPGGNIARYVPDLALDGSVIWAGGAALADLTLSGDGEKASFNLGFSGGDYTIAMPDWSEYYLWFASGLLSENEDSAVKLDGKALEKSLENVVREYLRIADDAADVEKGVELGEGKSKVKCDKYTVKFDTHMAAELMLFVSKELRGNENLLVYLASYAGYSDIDDALDEIYDELDYMDDSMEEALDERSERLFRMTTWVKGGGVVARKIDNVMGGGFEMYYENLSKTSNGSFGINGYDFTMGGAYSKSEDEINFSFSAGGSSSTYFSFVGALDNSGGAWSGEAVFSMTDYGDYYNLTAELDDVKVSGGQIVGEIIISGEYDGDSLGAELLFGKTGNKQTVSVEAEIISRYSERIDLGALELAYSISDVSGVTLPRRNENYGVFTVPYTYMLDEYEREENTYRAWDLAEDLEDVYDEYYDYNKLFAEIAYALIYYLV